MSHFFEAQGEPARTHCRAWIFTPEMEGEEVLKRIRELEAGKGFPFPQGSKIVMTTALADRLTGLESMKYRCDYYLAKPIER
jgi:CheY-like chemotaxis protein